MQDIPSGENFKTLSKADFLLNEINLGNFGSRYPLRGQNLKPRPKAGNIQQFLKFRKHVFELAGERQRRKSLGLTKRLKLSKLLLALAGHTQ